MQKQMKMQKSGFALITRLGVGYSLQLAKTLHKTQQSKGQIKNLITPAAEDSSLSFTPLLDELLPVSTTYTPYIFNLCPSMGGGDHQRVNFDFPCF